MGLVTQQDPIGIAGGLNLYGYANGDPINFSDPFGLKPDCIDRWAAILCAIVNLFHEGIQRTPRTPIEEATSVTTLEETSATREWTDERAGRVARGKAKPNVTTREISNNGAIRAQRGGFRPAGQVTRGGLRLPGLGSLGSLFMAVDVYQELDLMLNPDRAGDRAQALCEMYPERCT